MDIQELLKKVRKIEIKTKDLSNNIFSGEYHSRFKGRGMAFSEVREYQYSDDVKHIDWNVTARTGVPFVKIYEEERELTMILAVDVSRSSFFGTNHLLKSDLITEVSAVLSYSAIQNNDKVGLLLFTDEVETYIPPQKGRGQTLRIIRELLNYEPKSRTTDISKALGFINNVVKKRCICFLISDFQDEGFEKAMRVARQKNDLIAVHISDPAEKIMPQIGLFKAIDPETMAEHWVDSTDQSFRNTYTEWYVKRQQKLKKNLTEMNISMVELSTHTDYVKTLMKFFKTRV